MKIQNVKRSEGGVQSLQESQLHGGKDAKPIIFRKTLSEMSVQQRDIHLKALINDIDEQGAKLAKRIDIKEFEKYRRLIRDFIDDVVSNCYEFSKESAYGARGRHRFYTTVKTIDEKLDAMAKEVLRGQADNLEILGEIDDIRGLILDMLA